ncbi:MAG: hypothetical protein NZO58_02985 [Gemmataceae bacterium]|nr:hypothetical protein [Gemmataceae bacterium]
MTLRRSKVYGLALLVLACPAKVTAQDDDARILVLKAQKAHGGRETLNKYRAAQFKYKGDVDINGMQAKVEGEVFYNFPDRMKNVIQVDANGMKIVVQQGRDAKGLWVSVLGMTQEINDKELLDEMNESMYVEKVVGLADIDDKSYKFSTIGEMKIKNKDTIGVRVSRDGRRDVTLWIDKKTHLVVKSENRGKDPFGQGGEANQEKYFFDYQPVSGVQSPRRMEVHHDGKRIMELELTETRYHEKLDESQFNRP